MSNKDKNATLLIDHLKYREVYYSQGYDECQSVLIKKNSKRENEIILPGFIVTQTYLFIDSSMAEVRSSIQNPIYRYLSEKG